MSIEILKIDSDISYLADVDGDGVLEQVIARPFEVNFLKENKMVGGFKTKYKNVREFEKITSKKEEREGESIGEATSSILPITSEKEHLILVTRYNGITSLYSVSGRHLWSNYLGGFIRDAIFSDLNNDGKIELAMVSERGTIAILNQKGKLIRKISSVPYSRNIKLVTRDVNDDGVEEIGLYDGLHISWFDLKGQKILETDLGIKYDPSAVKWEDVNGDRSKELIIGTYNGKIYFYTLDGEKIGQLNLPSAIATMSTIDLNDDGVKELVACDRYGNIIVSKDLDIFFYRENPDRIKLDIDFDGEEENIILEAKKVVVRKNGAKLWSKVKSGWITAIDIGDIDNDGEKELAIASFDKMISINNVITGEEKLKIQTSKPPQAIAIKDFNRDGLEELLVLADNEAIVYKVSVKNSNKN